MRRLSEEIKRRIVEHLACYCGHTKVVELITNEFGVKLTNRHIRAYDPMSFQFSGSQRWQDYFQQVREQYSSEIGQIAIAHRCFRLLRLQDMCEEAYEKGDYRLCASILEQAAKEMGNCYQK